MGPSTASRGERRHNRSVIWVTPCWSLGAPDHSPRHAPALRSLWPGRFAMWSSPHLCREEAGVYPCMEGSCYPGRLRDRPRRPDPAVPSSERLAAPHSQALFSARSPAGGRDPLHFGMREGIVGGRLVEPIGAAAHRQRAPRGALAPPCCALAAPSATHGPDGTRGGGERLVRGDYARI